MPTFDDIWEVTPETAHETAQQLVPADSIVWDYSDDDSPVGNDIGADTFAAYLDFKKEQPDGKVSKFVANLFDVFELEDVDWDQMNPEAIQDSLDEDDGFSILTRDDFILGLAFAQLLVDGTVDPDVKSKAMLALKRQAMEVVLDFRDVENAETRREQLEDFGLILARA